MALNASGPISLGGNTAGQSIQLELGGTGTSIISLNDTNVRTLADVASGAIAMPTNFYGKSNAFTGTISTNETNLNLRTWALANGWNGSSAAIITINSGVIISGSVQSNSTAALTIDGSWPGGVSLINSGTIVGRGGSGGAGANTLASPASGSAGGRALTVSVAATITNNGTIAGGGGGGGGGSYRSVNLPGRDDDAGATRYPGCGGGGGASSNTNAPGGSAGTGGAGGAAAGGTGTYNSIGTGGLGGANNPDGGNGGTWGASGVVGASGGGAGGAGGQSVNGNSNITWTAFGTRLGAIV
jgi:hypothetical protein